MEGETEWQHIGEGNSFELQHAQKIINEHFSGDDVFLVVGRHDSKMVKKSEAASEVAGVLRGKNVLLCDTGFSEFIEFSYLGSFRRSARCS